MNELVSVIIPTYNNAEYLALSLESAFNQTYRDIEVIVIDDGSEDNTQEVVSRFRQVKCLKIDNGGSARARNIGIREASGNLIAFLDSDDIWLPSKVQKQVDFFKENADYGLCYTGKIFVDAQGKEIPHDFPWDYPSGNIFEKMLSGNYISTTSLVMTRKEVFEKSGYFDEHPDMRCSQDSNLWVRIAHDYKIGYIAEALVKYRYHTGGTSRSAIKTYRGKIYSQKKILEMYGKEKNIYAEKIRGRMEEFYKSYAYTFWKQKNYPMCRDALDGLMEIGSLSKKEFIYYYLSHVPLIANIVNR